MLDELKSVYSRCSARTGRTILSTVVRSVTVPQSDDNELKDVSAATFVAALWMIRHSICFSSRGFPSICSSLRLRLRSMVRCSGGRLWRVAVLSGMDLSLDRGATEGMIFLVGDLGMRRDRVSVDSAMEGRRD